MILWFFVEVRNANAAVFVIVVSTIVLFLLRRPIGLREVFEALFHALDGVSHALFVGLPSHKMYLLFQCLPLLADLVSKYGPHVSPHFHIGLRKNIELDTVPLLCILLLHQSLVPFAACIRRFSGEVLWSNLVPVEALRSGTNESFIVFAGP